MEVYIFNQTKDEGIYLTDLSNHMMNKKEALLVAEKIIKWYQGTDEKEIEAYNKKIDDGIENFMSSLTPHIKITRKGYIYLLECEGKYKIGFSKDVDRRIKELSNNPFKINLVAKSKFLENAYELEQIIHEKLIDYRINGEWYNLNQEVLEDIKKMIINMRGENEIHNSRF